MKGVKVICSVEGTRVGAVGSYTYLNFFPYGVQRVLVSRTSDIAHNHTWTPVGQESHCQPDVSKLQQKLQQHKIEHECKQISFEVRMRQADLSRLGNRLVPIRFASLRLLPSPYFGRRDRLATGLAGESTAEANGGY